MAISFVNAGATQLGTNPVVPVPSGYAAGDLLIIFVSSGSAPTTPSGWTVLYSSGFLFAYYKTAGASESSVTLSAGSNTCAAMCAYRGVGGIDVVGSSNSGASTSPATVSQTTTRDNDFVISIYQDTAATSATWTAPASTTSRVSSGSDGSHRGLLVVDELKATAGTTTARTATLSTTNGWSSITASIYPGTLLNSNFLMLF